MSDGPTHAATTVGRTSFTLRLWREPGDGWRGQVTHVQTGAALYFDCAPRLWSFVRACLGVAADDDFLDGAPPCIRELDAARARPGSATGLHPQRHAEESGGTDA